MQPSSLPPGFAIRRAGPADLDFLVYTDLLNEGTTLPPDEPPLSEADLAEEWAKIGAFVAGGDDAGWVVTAPAVKEPVGTIMVRFRDRFHEAPIEENLYLFRFLDVGLFPPDGRFCEVFNLWVHPSYRRLGLATWLKMEIESESRRQGMRMIYTHTEAANQHVITLNLKLGYEIVRTGPLWDEIPRVSLVKWLR